MDKIPKELEESQLNLQLVIDPETKCLTMQTVTNDLVENFDILPVEIIPNDPLSNSALDEIEVDKLSELEKLIYLERRRLINRRRPKKTGKAKIRRSNDRVKVAKMLKIESYHKLTHNEKSKLGMRSLREKESSEEREFRKFRGRISIMKSRLLQKLQNFEDETLLKEISKRNIDRVKQKRLEIKSKETPEQRALRRSRINAKSRLMKIRRRAFSTPEELLAEKEKGVLYARKSRSKQTEEERRAKRKIAREIMRKRRQKNENEWKRVQKVIKGAPEDKVLVKSELLEII